mmetsp:Transcript_147311/g.410365  ORF Transcript_147311/g.410365 Transcript_147311/m.410365 type:complete len:258 (+) Transcript_147311:67-840(+)
MADSCLQEAHRLDDGNVVSCDALNAEYRLSFASSGFGAVVGAPAVDDTDAHSKLGSTLSDVPTRVSSGLTVTGDGDDVNPRPDEPPQPTRGGNERSIGTDVAYSPGQASMAQFGETQFTELTHGPCLAEELHLPSPGSLLHSAGDCVPCKFFRGRRGCRDEGRCQFCHFPHAELTLSAVKRQHKLGQIKKQQRRLFEESHAFFIPTTEGAEPVEAGGATAGEGEAGLGLLRPPGPLHDAPLMHCEEAMPRVWKLLQV